MEETAVEVECRLDQIQDIDLKDGVMVCVEYRLGKDPLNQGSTALYPIENHRVVLNEVFHLLLMRKKVENGGKLDLQLVIRRGSAGGRMKSYAKLNYNIAQHRVDGGRARIAVEVKKDAVLAMELESRLIPLADYLTKLKKEDDEEEDQLEESISEDEGREEVLRGYREREDVLKRRVEELEEQLGKRMSGLKARGVLIEDLQRKLIAAEMQGKEAERKQKELEASVHRLQEMRTKADKEEQGLRMENEQMRLELEERMKAQEVASEVKNVALQRNEHIVLDYSPLSTLSSLLPPTTTARIQLLVLCICIVLLQL